MTGRTELGLLSEAHRWSRDGLAAARLTRPRGTAARFNRVEGVGTLFFFGAARVVHRGGDRADAWLAWVYQAVPVFLLATRTAHGIWLRTSPMRSTSGCRHPASHQLALCRSQLEKRTLITAGVGTMYRFRGNASHYSEINVTDGTRVSSLSRHTPAGAAAPSCAQQHKRRKRVTRCRRVLQH